MPLVLLVPPRQSTFAVVRVRLITDGRDPAGGWVKICTPQSATAVGSNPGCITSAQALRSPYTVEQAHLASFFSATIHINRAAPRHPGSQRPGTHYGLRPVAAAWDLLQASSLQMVCIPMRIQPHPYQWAACCRSFARPGHSANVLAPSHKSRFRAARGSRSRTAQGGGLSAA